MSVINKREMITFMTFGDFGLNTPLREQNTEMMIAFKKKNNVDAVLSLGDNFYNYGVKSVSDPQWRDFEKTFDRLKCPFYAILGNHDYLGNFKAQIDYPLKNKDTIFRMPSRYYDKEFVDGDGSSVHVFFLDTFTLCPNESRMCSVAMGMMNFDRVFGEKDLEQYRWLDNGLRESGSTWKIVVGHYPVFSNGHHGDTEELVEDLFPLLKKHSVDFYLCGHDHDLEFIRKDDINFIVSGTGCSSNPVSFSPQSIYASNTSTFGFNILNFTKEFARFGFATNNGTQLWYSIPKQKNVRYNNYK
jgi:acid phosphatase